MVRLLNIDTNLKQEDLLKEFSDQELSIKNLILANDGKTSNCGFGFVEFNNIEDFKKFVDIYKLKRSNDVYSDVIYSPLHEKNKRKRLI